MTLLPPPVTITYPDTNAASQVTVRARSGVCYKGQEFSENQKSHVKATGDLENVQHGLLGFGVCHQGELCSSQATLRPASP